MGFKRKYLKYKYKYLRLKQLGGDPLRLTNKPAYDKYYSCKKGLPNKNICPDKEYRCLHKEECLNENGENLLTVLKRNDLGDFSLDDIRGNEKLPEDILTIINSFNDCKDIIKYLNVNKKNINNITPKVWDQLIKNKDLENFNVEQSEFVKASMCKLITDVELRNKCYEFYTRCQLKYLDDKYDMSEPRFAWHDSIRRGNVDDYKLFNNFTDTKTIDQAAFTENELTSVVIPNSVTTIGIGAFYKNKLTSVVIPNSVITIDKSAFRNNELTSVTIGKSVTTIGIGAFADNYLENVEIPNSVTIIGNYAFYNNKLTSVVIPDSVKTIGNNAFNNNKLTSIEIPDSVETIGKGAFRNNELKFVKIPDSVKGTFLINQSFDPQVNIYYKNTVLKYNSYLWQSVIL